MQSEIARPYDLKGHEASISVSIGICPFGQEIVDAQAMLAQADVALYRSKADGRNQYHFHSEDLDRSVLERVSLAGELLRAIEGDELELQYQPQVELSSGKIVGMEALVRWHHPTWGLLAPGAFIPIAEKTGIITSLGAWVLNQACRQMKAWRDQGLAPSVMAVNLSLHQLKHGAALLREVTETLARWELPASDLEFDVTEATLAQLKWTQNEVLPSLRALGVKIAIDGFGSEYSSFDYIKEYRVNHLKIASSYIRESAIDSDHAAAMRAIVAFARDIGIAVIAQGVETSEQSSLLKETHSATQAQGFHFSEPVSADRAASLLRAGRIQSS
jgi:EAL domain-containing protein (putative c-di-GMP-specific phosphodiesterase class I)